MAGESGYRFLYRISAFLALPGGLWAAFEMYGLTLRGSQMLFFTIAHVMLPLVLAVWLSVPAGLLWLVQSGLAIARPGYQKKLAVSRSALAVFVIAISFQGASLSWYGLWSGTALRVPVCLLGLALTALVVRCSWAELRRAVPWQAARIDA